MKLTVSIKFLILPALLLAASINTGRADTITGSGTTHTYLREFAYSQNDNSGGSHPAQLHDTDATAPVGDNFTASDSSTYSSASGAASQDTRVTFTPTTLDISTHLHAGTSVTAGYSADWTPGGSVGSWGWSQANAEARVTINFSIDVPFSFTLIATKTVHDGGVTPSGEFAAIVRFTNSTGTVVEYGQELIHTGQGTDTLNGASSGAANGTIAAGTYTLDAWAFDLQGGDGYNGVTTNHTSSSAVDVSLYVSTVPEPSTWAMLALGIPALLAFRRFGRRSA